MINQIKSYAYSSDEDLFWDDVSYHLGAAAGSRLNDFRATLSYKVNTLYDSISTTLILISHNNNHVCYLIDQAEDAVYALFITDVNLDLIINNKTKKTDALDIMLGRTSYINSKIRKEVK